MKLMALPKPPNPPQKASYKRSSSWRKMAGWRSSKECLFRTQMDSSNWYAPKIRNGIEEAKHFSSTNFHCCSFSNRKPSLKIKDRHSPDCNLRCRPPPWKWWSQRHQGWDSLHVNLHLARFCHVLVYETFQMPCWETKLPNWHAHAHPTTGSWTLEH